MKNLPLTDPVMQRNRNLVVPHEFSGPHAEEHRLKNKLLTPSGERMKQRFAARRIAPGMKQIVAVIFGLGLLCNALLFVPQVIAVWRKKSDEGISLITFGGFSILQAIGIVHGLYQRDLSLILGMAASLLTCGAVTLLTILYRVRRIGAGRGQPS
jgi:MtN3 and saliva related transmembrane protein